MITALAKDQATVNEDIARMIMGMPDGRRQLRSAKSWSKHRGKASDPILRPIIEEHSIQITDVPFYFEHHAPIFAGRLRALLGVPGADDDREVIAANPDTGRRESTSRPIEIPIYVSGPLEINDPLETTPIRGYRPLM